MWITEEKTSKKMKETTPADESAHDILRLRRRPLDVFFAPRNVAVIGATETPASVGRTIVWNLINSPFGGTVFPVNPKRSSVLGIHAYPRVEEVPDEVDLAVIVTPAKTVPGVVSECVRAGVKGAIIISAGFKEAGKIGADLERQVLEEARRGRMRIIGPNCLGVMSPLSGLNATFATTIARPGNVALVSQSGAICTAILDWSLREQVGFSAFLSIGSMLDVGWGDLIEYLGDDPRTRSIIMYMESIGDARAFVSAAREVALSKPIIVIKAGRSEAAAKAAASHTGSLAGSDEVLEAAFRRSGVLRVHNISDLFYMSEVLAKQPRPAGPRLTILTNAGGPGVLAADAVASLTCKLADVSDETMAAFNEILPPHWSHGNPIDILGDADPQRYAKAVGIAAKDTASDGLLVIMTPQGMTDPTQIAEQLKPHAKLDGKPILASWMGGVEAAGGEEILNHAGIPTFPYPDTAVRVFDYMWRYTYNLRGLYETPAVAPEADSIARGHVAAMIDDVRKSGRTLLTEAESKQLLALYGIPTVRTLVAKTVDEAVKSAGELGYPVVLKLHSETVTHKTDVGGVQLNLPDEAAVRWAWSAIESGAREKAGEGHFLGVTVQPMVARNGYELIVGSSIDAQFGPVLLFGSGGMLVEVYKDRALALPPLNTTLARRMMEQTRIYTALQGVRGQKPVPLAELEQLLVRFSRLVVEQPWIKEIDINPLMASPERLIALDARVILHPAETRPQDLPRTAIRPYPVQYVSRWTMKDGAAVTIRPIRPEDEPMMVAFHERLSERSVYFRYFHLINLNQRTAHERLTRICFIDYDREMALVAERENPATNQHEILGVGRMTRLHGTGDAEMAILISDQFHRRGLGTELLRRLIEIGRAEKVERIVADILAENRGMQQVCERLGFRLDYQPEDGMVKAEIKLG
ncbi:MAG TPA: bifunctional acetate--CoA ligase family protein/GNAT family N-acetyltransferase [Bryobacteraceae bacterium]|nr:bifunctional acetate--CoA ligase family protein/GNAT family N-acetyltransferase [Bryobacteraceae bacterium]